MLKQQFHKIVEACKYNFAYRGLLIMLGLYITFSAYATPELNSYKEKGKYVEFNITFRYKNAVQDLYYQALVKNLDVYIDSLKKAGHLTRGKIYFDIMTAQWMDEEIGIEVSRFQNGYYCNVNALHQQVNQQYLCKIILYFCSDNWESFCYDYQKIQPQYALQIFNERLKNIVVNHRFKPVELVDLNTVKVIFRNDSLLCMAGSKTYGTINCFIPFIHNGRTFFQTDWMIYIMEGGKSIMEFAVPKKHKGFNFYGIEQCLKWINFISDQSYYLSYSMEKNKFYQLQ